MREPDYDSGETNAAPFTFESSDASDLMDDLHPPVADPSVVDAQMPGHERRGCVEIRWSDGDPDDVVAPWPRSLEGTSILVHVERMSEGSVWMAIYDKATGEDVHMWFHAAKKNVLEWTVRDA